MIKKKHRARFVKLPLPPSSKFQLFICSLARTFVNMFMAPGWCSLKPSHAKPRVYKEEGVRNL